ncbi:MAG: dTDP-4-dehydrorhamnose 3,5-epimerase [Acidobacteriota bacterium]
MRFTETKLKDAFVIEPKKLEDERGFFARAYCLREFEQRGLSTRWAQCNISFNKKRSTLRGMHWQDPPHSEIKLVRCTRGAVYDVIVDVRPGSATFKQWVGVELTDANARLLYIPQGFAHGYLTLADDVEVFYQVSEFYHPESARSARWNDPVFGIQWPAEPTVMSSKDREAEDFTGNPP